MLDIAVSAALGQVLILKWFLVFFALERVFPATEVDTRGLKANWGHWPIYSIANMLISTLMSASILSWIRGSTGGGLLAGLGLSAWHPVALAVVNLLLFDLFYYWYHRLQHTVPWLWHQHLIHHSDADFNSSTAHRHHVTENLLKFPIVDLPLSLLLIDGIQQGTVGPVSLAALGLVQCLGILAHTNIRLGWGPLAWLVVSPQQHRIHHSNEGRHRNRNFAAYFPFIDVAFGTYWHPSAGEYPSSGMGAFRMDSPRDMVMYPFRKWGAGLRRRFGAPTVPLPGPGRPAP